jgi:lysyl-tRNA synthetase, class II
MIQEEQDRLARLDRLRKIGVDPYPTKGTRTIMAQEFLDRFDALLESGSSQTIAGRLRLLRPHGGLTFGQIQDQSGLIQVAFRLDHIGEESYTQIKEMLDLGDFIEVTGLPFTTRKGERSIDASAFRFLSKTTLPLPEKWHGLNDVEMRFRKRYLDLIMNDDVRQTMVTRSRIISAIRSLLDGRDFLEVETPTLQPMYGGGYARPFTTHHNALDADFYLRISDEMYLKRLLVGGLEKIYEVTKVFRNEGIDRDHNPEFTMFEAQVAYENYNYGMDLFEEIFEHAAKKVLGSTQVDHTDVIIELKRPWTRMKLIDAVQKLADIPAKTWESFEGAMEVMMKKIAKKKQGELKQIRSVGELLAFAFEELVEAKLIQPTIIYDYPVEVSPLAKRCVDDARFVERFEAFALGSELGNNYSELNDPVDLERRFLEEKDREKAGFDEAHETDHSYLEAIKHGMPPSCGLGIGIDRMVMLLTGAKNIKEVILFPTLRPDQRSE